MTYPVFVASFLCGVKLIWPLCNISSLSLSMSTFSRLSSVEKLEELGKKLQQRIAKLPKDQEKSLENVKDNTSILQNWRPHHSYGEKIGKY